MIVELLANEVAVGNCVIINTCEQPCGDLVAIVVAVNDATVTAKYLSKRIDMKTCSGRAVNVTPINAFGYRVMLEDGKFWCEQNGVDSTAKYENGDTRRWQEYSGPIKRTPKQDVLMLAVVR